MDKQKYYVVKEGHTKGVFLSWDACKKMVEGYKGAVYKSFKDPYEAMDFLLEKTDDISMENDTIEAYVDGSFDSTNKAYGSGVVLIKNGEIIEEISRKGTNEDNLPMRNVAGEIEAAMISMKYCYDNGYDNLVIYFDYNGIEKWCTGEWKANKKGTQEYKEFCEKVKKSVKIKFIKVKSHSGDKYNDLADLLAKKSISIL